MLLMKSVKMACVHPATLQLFQKVVESILGSEPEGSATGEEEEDLMDTQTGSGGAGEMARLVQGGDLDWPKAGRSSAELGHGTEGALVC